MLTVRSPVYVILNHPSRASAWEVGEAAVAAGVGMLQFRSKGRLPEGDVTALRALARRAAGVGVPLLVNDAVDLAAEVGAAGVHLGQSDASPGAAREALGASAVIGVTTPTVELARAAERAGADYVAVGAMYPSPTKPEKPVLGPERLRAVAGAVALPVCAIGGITMERVPELLAAGAQLLAVISAVGSALDPGRAARELVAACDEARP
ncbi:MAG: thiamine phosphate synthase [Armatimonadetes bacterium]|nr:thiamine phosphate synthase [Armatimonadota bacterium]